LDIQETLNRPSKTILDVVNPGMPRSNRHPADHRPTLAATKWATELRREMQGMIGRQLRTHYEPPRDLSPQMAALLTRMDEHRL
jgi:hypothetical protein